MSDIDLAYHTTNMLILIGVQFVFTVTILCVLGMAINRIHKHLGIKDDK